MLSASNSDWKLTSKKFLIISLITLVITFICCLIFIWNANIEFFLTKTIFSELTSSLDGNTPGSGELLFLSLIISTFTFLGELGIMLIVILLFFVVPVSSNSLLFFINLIARLFQIGENKRWKNIITKTLLVISLIIQGILLFYLLLLFFTGFSWIYLIIYLMFAFNVFAFIKNICYIKKQ